MKRYNEVLQDVTNRTGIDLTTDVPQFETEIAYAVVNVIGENLAEDKLVLVVGEDTTQESQLDLEYIDFFFINYLRYLSWKYPESQFIPFTILKRVPDKKKAFLSWYLMVQFLTTSAELSEHYHQGSTLPKAQIAKVLELDRYLKGHKFNVEGMSKNKYYFTDCIIQFS